MENRPLGRIHRPWLAEIVPWNISQQPSIRFLTLGAPQPTSLPVPLRTMRSCLKYDEIKPDANTHRVRRRFIQKKQ
jgi:hypothetical protein